MASKAFRRPASGGFDVSGDGRFRGGNCRAPQMRIVRRAEMVHLPCEQLELQAAGSQGEKIGDKVGIQLRGCGI